ncbi:MAG: 1,4-dihydroxy-2-naphthoate octaprenyltransferase [Omnitrophica WOR_2 bacterium RIFCSPHIGHO2_01_FULL_52_10]|nr:MAG: 1,4-dihydroxy-2-naphthoate octaprenyltransferase [Omnitrophica WOR_2 bacterium RIFCSPHIGHO2_01_FULL_52_10]
MNNSSIKYWLLAIRPKTLPAAVAPVLMGTAMAFGDGIEDVVTALVCLLTALLLQIGTNLANDYYDCQKGADTLERVGPTRVTQAGLIPPGQVKAAFIGVFALAALASICLVTRGGWPIAALASLAILSGIFYTAGHYPLGYLGLGDILVFIFFGPVAVAGTYYVQSLELNSAIIFAGFAPGLMSVAILTVNNLRDIDSDRKSGKNTLAVRFGRGFALSEYLFCVLGAGIVPVFIYMFIEDHLPLLACVLIILAVVPTIKTVLTRTEGVALNAALAATARLLLAYSVLFSIGWVL